MINLSFKITFKISEVLKAERDSFTEQMAVDTVNALKGGDVDIRHYTKDPESNTWTFSIYKLEVVES